MKLWKVEKSKQYTDGIKYSLIFIEPSTGKRILMDNHSPKGHHYHVNDQEKNYVYKDIHKFVDDFRAFVKEHMGVTL